ncbi:K(+)/H(+) antiporter [Coemansia sp. RSA 2671]|nr:K(+)/H(+) antiporter [Coemansia sp. RSA 2675]KAJ2350445.1 K(+)/H(+) antiporter [Coemansia sp. RSA 2671]
MAGGTSSPSIISGRNPIAYSTSDPLALFIVQLLIIVCICRFLHMFLQKINQPSVISEILGGIILGPTVLGRWTAFTTNVFPPASLTNLNLVANFGLVLFLFMVGLELDPRVLKHNLHRSIIISAAGIALPFSLGIASSYALYHVLMKDQGSFVNFLLFLGVAMAITAFPVLARILTEQNLLKTTVGSIAISAAAIDDVVSWCLLALVIALTNNTSGLTALWVLLVGAAWVLFILFAVKPVYLKYLRHTGCLSGRDPPQIVLFVTFMMVLISAFFTDSIGIHAIFGAFLVGVIVPHDGGFAIKVTEKIEDLVQIFLLPIYFALSGLKTNLSDLNDGNTWGLLVLVCVVAFVGKIAGCTLAARMSKFSWRESLTIGFLMNCKGLVELIVLNIGLQAGVINTKIFTMMVVMALVTTFVTSPVVAYLYPLKYQRRVEDFGKAGDHDNASALTKRHGPEAGAPMSILVVLSRLQQVPGVMTLLGYLHHQPELSSTRKLTANISGAHAQELIHRHLYRPIRVFGLRLLELSGRNSSIMNEYESDLQVMTDPAMSMFRAFARVANLIFHAALSYSEREHFVDNVLGSARDADAEFTVVSAFGRGSTGANNGEIVPGWFESMGWGFTTDQQAAFITALFDRARGHVGVFIDCGIADGGDFSAAQPAIALPAEGDDDDDEEQTKQKETRVMFSTPGVVDHGVAGGPSLAPMYFGDGRRVPLVVVPFFGGPDDRQAVQLAADLCTHSAVQVLVWRFVRAAEHESQDHLTTVPPTAHLASSSSIEQHDLDLATTRVNNGDAWNAEAGTAGAGKGEAFEKEEDEVFISSCLHPRSLDSNHNMRRDSVASAVSGVVGASASPAASPRGPGATQAIAAPPSIQPQLGLAATRDTLERVSTFGENQGAEGGGGIRQKITQKLRLRQQGTRSTTEPAGLRHAPGGDGLDRTGGIDDDSTLSPGLRVTQFANLTIETIVTATPLQTFLLKARLLSAPDLIVCGRSVQLSLPYFNNAHELAVATQRPSSQAHTKAERHHALGSVAEYILGFGTSASLLVVQASQKAMGFDKEE